MVLPPAIAAWLNGLETVRLSDVAREPSSTAIVSADMVRGFCDEGPLSSARIGALKSGVTDFFRRAHDAGVRDFVLLQDTHDEDALEFDAFPPHCVRDTNESRTIDELRALPFSSSFTIIEKNTLTPAIETSLEEWLVEHAGLQTAIVVGDCTDLCVYQAAMFLRLRANALRLAEFHVVVPAILVDTYDQPGVHGGDFFHAVFLYHMALNGIRVVRALS